MDVKGESVPLRTDPLSDQSTLLYGLQLLIIRFYNIISIFDWH